MMNIFIMYFIRILWSYAPPTPPHTPAASIKATYHSVLSVEGATYHCITIPFCPSVCLSVRLSVRPSVRLSVCPFIAYIANNAITQRPSVPKFGRKVPRLRDVTRTPVSKSNGQRSGQAGGGIPRRPNPATTLLVFLCVY